MIFTRCSDLFLFSYDEEEVVELTEKDVRPRARTKIPFSEV